MEITFTDRPIVKSDRVKRFYYEYAGVMRSLSPDEQGGGIEAGSWRTITEQPPVLVIPAFYEKFFELNDTIRQIRELIDGDYEDEIGILRPTQSAINRVVGLLIEACFAFIFEEPKRGIVFPKALVAPDLEGGLRIEWTLKSATVTLVVPPHKDAPKEYLCKRIAGISKLEFNLSGSLVASWLKRFS